MKIQTRKEAIAEGSIYYFTGKPCPRGHVGLRTVRKCECLECQREQRKNSPYNVNRKKMAKRVRRAWSIKSIPKWADFEKINEVYDYAKSVGKFVDHIVPQRSWLVCGLHSHHNVEPIDPHWNRAKSDRFWPDMPTYSYEDILELRSIWESQNLVLPDKKK